MTKLQKLEQAVRDLYEKRNPARADWADWLYENHVFVVADFAEELALRYNADVQLCRAAAVLHDIADTVMSRFDPTHEEESLAIARKLLAEAGYTKNEIATIADDAIRYHSCHDGKRPKTLVGDILATADALAHLTTDFYTHTTEVLMKDRPKADTQSWAAKKIPRDYHDKIAFDEVREETKPYYEKLTARFLI